MAIQQPSIFLFIMDHVFACTSGMEGGNISVQLPDWAFWAFRESEGMVLYPELERSRQERPPTKVGQSIYVGGAEIFINEACPSNRGVVICDNMLVASLNLTEFAQKVEAKDSYDERRYPLNDSKTVYREEQGVENQISNRAVAY